MHLFYLFIQISIEESEGFHSNFLDRMKVFVVFSSIFFQNFFFVQIQTIPINSNDGKNVLEENSTFSFSFLRLELNLAMTRLYEQFERVRLLLNPQPDVITLVSEKIAEKLKSSRRELSSEQFNDDDDDENESKTVFVNLNIDFQQKYVQDQNEELPTKFINMFIDSRPKIFQKYTNSNDDDDSIEVETKFVYLSIDTNRRSSPSFRRYRRNLVEN